MERAAATAAGLIHGQVLPPTTAQLEYGLRALFTRLRAGERRRRRGWWRWTLAGLAIVAGATALVLVRRSPEPLLTAPGALVYKVEGGNVVAGGYLRESAGGGVKLSFSEGTEFALMPGTHGRLRSVGAAGARIAIEQGTAYFQVTPNTGRTWLVDVGPFLVTVKGTVFTVSWDPLGERFELRLRRGRVVVSGPVSGGDIVLREGQRLKVDLPRAETLISEDKDDKGDKEGSPGPGTDPDKEWPRPARTPAEQSSGTVRPVAPVLARPPVGRTAVAAAPAGRSGHGPRSRRWSEALASGDWDAILTDVDRDGVRGSLDRVSSEELFALADAARYRHRLELAGEALLAVRRRFPGSARTLDTSFLLGRVEEASGHGAARALRWYDEYLAHAPTGTYASEALGRRMTLTNDIEGSARARPIAEEYLRRFPAGTYAGAARVLLR